MPDYPPGVTSGGTPRGGFSASYTTRGGTTFGVSRGGSIGIDTSDLTQLSKSLKQVDTDIKKIVDTVDKLTASLNKAGTAANNLVGGSGSNGGNRLTTGNFSGPFAKGGGAGTGTSSLGLAAAAEIGTQWAGGVNNYMSTFQSNGMATNLSAQQLNALSGTKNTPANVTAQVNSWLNVKNMSTSDLAQMLGTVTSNPMLRPQNKMSQKNLTGFLNAAQTLNQSMGAAGAANFANTLVSGSTTNALMRYAGGGGSQGLLNLISGNMNSPQQTFRALLNMVTGGTSKNMTAAQITALGKSSRDWASIGQSFGQGGIQGTNLSPAMLMEIQQFAASGGNLSAAERSMGTSAMSTALRRTTASTKTATDIFETSQGGQEAVNNVIASFTTAVGQAATALGPFTNMLVGAAGLLGPGLALASKGAEGATLASVLLGKGGAGGLSGLLKGVGGAGLVAAGGSMASSLLGKVVGGGQTGGTRASVGGLLKDVGTGASIGAGIGMLTGPFDPAVAALGGLAGAAYHFFGDPPTGSTNTSGMHPALASRVSAMMAANPNLHINSGHRSRQQQRMLHALKGGRGVAKPGHSMHEHGLAADIGPSSQMGWIAKNAHKFGLSRPDKSEPWHVQMGDPLPYPSPANTQQYSRDLLASMNLPATAANVDVFTYMTESRTGYGLNPLGNTQPWGKSSQISTSAYGNKSAGAALNATGHGVQSYPNWSDSIAAARSVLMQGNNSSLIGALKSGKSSLSTLEGLLSGSGSSWAGEQFAPGITAFSAKGKAGGGLGALSVGGGGGGTTIGRGPNYGSGGSGTNPLLNALFGALTQSSLSGNFLQQAGGSWLSGISGGQGASNPALTAAIHSLAGNRSELAALLGGVGDPPQITSPMLMGDMGGSARYVINMPLQVVQVTEAEAERLVTMIMKKIEQKTGVSGIRRS